MAIHEKNTIREIGDRLKKLREHLNYSRKRMAAFLGVTSNGYGKNECGINFPSIPTLKRLSKELNISMDWLIFNRGPMYIQEAPPAVNTEVAKKPSLVEIIPDLKELLDYMEQNQQFRYEVLAFFYKYKKEQ
jgi:transcriptional regulator with XRE-family HTH domain